VIKEYGDGTRKLDKLALEGAISSIVREFVDDKDTIVDAARGSFIDLVVKRVGKEWSEWVLGQVREVKEEDVRKTFTDVIANVFDPTKTDLVITCGGNMVEVSFSLSLLHIKTVF
jgi:hypothetical protein